MMNTKVLSVVTPLSIYHMCSTRKTFWEEKFTSEENFTFGEFTAVNMKYCGRCNVRKHREIKSSDKYVSWISCWNLRFWTIWESHLQIQKVIYEDQERGWLPLWVSRPKTMPKKYKKARYAIGNISKKEISEIIRKFEKLPYESYERKRPKHEPTDS